MTSLWAQKCETCGETAEVSLPDGKGGQVYYCGMHEPPALFPRKGDDDGTTTDSEGGT